MDVEKFLASVSWLSHFPYALPSEDVLEPIFNGWCTFSISPKCSFFNCESLPKMIFFTGNKEGTDPCKIALKLLVMSIRDIPALIGIFGGHSYIINHTKIIQIFTQPQLNPTTPHFVKLLLPHVSLQFFHEIGQIPNSRAMLSKTVDTMLKTLKPQVHDRLLLVPKPTTPATSTSTSATSTTTTSTTSTSTSTTTSDNEPISSTPATNPSTSTQPSTLPTKRTLAEVHTSKAQKYAEWSAMVGQLCDPEKPVPVAEKTGFVGEGDKKQLQQCVDDIGKQIKDEIATNLKASRASRNIDSEVKNLISKRKKYVAAWESLLLNEMVELN